MEDNYLIQELVERKNFAQLTNEEKGIVLSEISQEEYESRRAIVENTRAFLQDGILHTEPKADVKKRAAALMQVKNQERKGFAAMVVYRMPVYAAVAAMLVMIFVLPLFYANEKPEVKYVATVDTVYQQGETKIVHDTVLKEKETVKYVSVPVIKYVEVATANLPDENLANRIESPNTGIVPTVSFAKDQLQGQLKNIGKSSNEQEELNKFLVSSR